MSGIPERLSEASLARRKNRRQKLSGEFLRGPVPITWLAKASSLPGKALAVGLLIWFRIGCRPDRVNVSICNSALERFGVSRMTGYRALRDLEQAGLVTVVRKRGRCPRVTIKAKASK